MDRSAYDVIRLGKQPMPPAAGLVRVQNLSGAAVQRFGVLGISGVFRTPANNLSSFQDNPILTGVTPTVANYTNKFVITAGNINNNAMGWAYAFGVCPVQVLMNNTTDAQADVNDSDTTQLSSGSSGMAQILYVAGTSGTQWALVRIGLSCVGD